MCQPKPGPRCSAHARGALARARAEKAAAELDRDNAQHAYRNSSDLPAGDRQALRDAAVAADERYWAKQRAYTAALRDFETTPEGMEALRQAATEFDTAGDAAAGREVRSRLAEAEATRHEQVTLLALSRAHAERLAHATAAEQARLDAADAKVAELEAAVATLEKQRLRTAEEVDRARRDLDEIERARQGLVRARAAAEEEARAAAAAAGVEAKRLYVEAGVSERFAGFYANDMVEAACPRSRGYSTDAGDTTPTRTLSVKVKRTGPDRDKTLAAKTAAETDPDFAAANQRLAATLARVSEAREAANAAYAASTAPAQERLQAASRAATSARYAHEDTQNDLTSAKAKAADLRARIGSGLGTMDTRTERMDRVRDDIVRNPDGTTNAYLYQPPAEGFPHGAYLRATGVIEVHGMAPANALVLETGRKAWLHGHYARTTRGAGESQSGYTHVVLTPAQPGSTPLHAEGVPGAGYYTFIDSSD